MADRYEYAQAGVLSTCLPQAGLSRLLHYVVGKPGVCGYE